MKIPGLKPTTSKAAAPRVQFVPGDYFFARRFDLPAGTDPAELAGFVELRLEELSPFPLDQLHHGFARAADGSGVFVYAAYRRRLPPGQADAWDNALFVLPDFAPALRLRFSVETVVLFRSDAAITALFFQPGRDLPERFASRALPVGAPGEVIEAVREAVLALVRPGSAHEVAFLADPGPEQRAQGLSFVLAADGLGAPVEVVIPMSECWTMDVREPEFVATQRKQLGVDLIFWRAVQGAVAAIALLLIGELFLLAGGGYTAWLNKRVRDRAPAAAAIADRNALAIGLDDFRNRGVHPFEAFRIVVAGKPQSVIFTNSSLEGMRLEIDGTAPSVAEYNAYLTALRTIETIASVEESGDPRTANNVTTFKLVVMFKPGVFGSVAGGSVAAHTATP